MLPSCKGHAADILNSQQTCSPLVLVNKQHSASPAIAETRSATDPCPSAPLGSVTVRTDQRFLTLGVAAAGEDGDPGAGGQPLRDHLTLLADHARDLKAGRLARGERDARLAQELVHAGLDVGQLGRTRGEQFLEIHSAEPGGRRRLAGWLTRGRSRAHAKRRQR